MIFRYGLRSGILFLCDLFIALSLFAETLIPSEKTFPESNPYSTASSTNEHLAQIHDGALFAMKHYATLEALITALEQGRDENSAFLVGTASLIPGAGQMINKNYLTGGLLLFGSSLSLITLQQFDPPRQRYKREDLLPLYYSSLLIRNGIMTYATLHATDACYRHYQDRTAAMWTGIASLLPGAGQAVNHQWLEAAAFLVSWSLAAFLTAQLEEEVFINNDNRNQGYLVQDHEPVTWSFAWAGQATVLQVTFLW